MILFVLFALFSQAQAIGVVGSLINADGTLKDDPREVFYQKNHKIKVFDKKERRWKKVYATENTMDIYICTKAS